VLFNDMFMLILCKLLFSIDSFYVFYVRQGSILTSTSKMANDVTSKGTDMELLCITGNSVFCLHQRKSDIKPEE